MRRNFYPETFVFMEPGGEPTPDNIKGLKPVQIGWHAAKTFTKVGKKRIPVSRVPVFKGIPASLARYIRAQRKRMMAGKRCNLTPGYVK